MNLLSYTKKLSDQINYYDRMAKNNFFNNDVTNPFKRLLDRPVNLTIVWVDNDCNDD